LSPVKRTTRSDARRSAGVTSITEPNGGTCAARSRGLRRGASVIRCVHQCLGIDQV
jgi:hypothetical protein